MLSRTHVIRALEARRSDFAEIEQSQLEARDRYREYLLALAGESRADLDGALRGIPYPGARPTDERVSGVPVVRHFHMRWQNHQEARAWAMERLRGVRTIAVDGSQVMPDSNLASLVGAVQIGWFENPHDPSERYVKDLAFDVLSPLELATEQSDLMVSAEQLVNARRFELECRHVARIIRSHAGERPAPVVFFDGSLAISFAAQMRPPLRDRHIEAVQEMLDASEEAQVPLVAYVDSSHARDLVFMLRWRYDRMLSTGVSDGAILRTLMDWGDRTETYTCAREDRLFEGAEELDYYPRVQFLYLKASSAHPPVRLDLPAWIQEAGLLDDVVDIVRAECVIGTGYPYPIETADSLAVITGQDRERFLAILHEFVQANGVHWTFPRKALSKRGRR